MTEILIERGEELTDRHRRKLMEDSEKVAIHMAKREASEETKQANLLTLYF